MRSHADIDRRSLALHRLVAEKVRSNPAHLAAVRATLEHWRSTVSPHAQPYLREWERLLDDGAETALAKAVEDSAHAAALRQASPFCGVLTSHERHEFLRTWKRLRQTGK